MPLGESANDFSWMYNIGQGENPNPVDTSPEGGVPGYQGQAGGMPGWNSGASIYQTQGPQAWADWYKSQYPDWASNVATNKDTGFWVDPTMNPFNNPGAISGRRNDAFGVKQSGGGLSDIKGAFGNVTSSGYGLRPDLENPAVQTTGGQGKNSTDWLETWIPRIVMGVMGYGTAAGLFGAGGLLSGEAAAGAGSGVGAGTGTGFGTTGSAVSAFTPAQQAAMMAGADGMGGTAAAGSTAGLGDLGWSTAGQMGADSAATLGGSGATGLADASVAAGSTTAEQAAQAQQWIDQMFGDLGGTGTTAGSAATSGGNIAAGMEGNAAFIGPPSSAASQALSPLESFLSKMGVLNNAGKFSLGGTLKAASGLGSGLSTLKGLTQNKDASNQRLQQGLNVANPSNISSQMNSIFGSSPQGVALGNQMLQLLQNPGSLSPGAYERAQEQTNQAVSGMQQAANARMGASGWGANSGMSRGLQEAAAAQGGALRANAARDYTTLQEQLRRQDIQQASQTYLGLLNDLTNMAQMQEQAITQWPWQAQGTPALNTGAALANLLEMLGIGN